jgi:hypothetical protein
LTDTGQTAKAKDPREGNPRLGFWFGVMPSAAVHAPISALDIFKLLLEKGSEHLGRAHIKPLIEAFDRLLLPACFILKEKGASPVVPKMPALRTA